MKSLFKNSHFVAAASVLSVALLCYAATLGVLAMQGCAGPQLDPAGVYHGDAFAASVDKTLVDSKDSLERFVDWEAANHAEVVATWPAITKAANQIRKDAPLWFTNAFLLKSNYFWLRANRPAQAPAVSNQLQSAISALAANATAASQLTNSVSK